MATAVDPVPPGENPLCPAAGKSFSILEAWHLFSLDAPTIAVLWSLTFAGAMRIDLPWHAPLALALGTWLIYVADRLLDGHFLTPLRTLQRRHRFHRQYRAAFLLAAGIVAPALAWLVAARMSGSARKENAALFLISMLYFFLVHNPRGDATRWLPKEIAVGILFAAATAVPAWSRLDRAGRTALLPAAILFAALCWLNCVAIESWESIPLGRKFQVSSVHVSTRWTANRFQATTITLFLASAASAVARLHLSPKGAQPTAMLYLPLSLSALSLIWIERNRRHFSQLHLRIAADAALLTPMLCLPFVIR